MTFSSQQKLQQQLDKLAVLGMSRLSRHARMTAVRHYLPLGMWLFLPVPLISILLQFDIEPAIASSIWFWIAYVTLPLFGYLGCIYWQLSHQRCGRQQGLALYDQQLQLADRLQIADEFCAIANPSGFQKAAMTDAAKAIELAKRHSLVDLAVISKPLPWSAKFSLPLSGILVGLLVYRVMTTAPIVESMPIAQVQTVQQTEEVPSDNDNASALKGHNPAATQSTSKQQETLGKMLANDAKLHDRVTSTFKASNLNLANRQSAAASQQSSSAADESANVQQSEQNVEAQAKPSASTPQLASRQSMTTEQSAERHRAAAMTNSEQASHNSASAKNSGSYQQAELRQEKSASSNSTEENNDEEQSQKENNQGNSASAGQQGSSKNKKPQPKKQKQAGQQQQNSGGQQNNNSENSRNQGDDAQKKSRGINQLMLAVPMEDQFIGTPGPGSEQRSMRSQKPNDQAVQRLPSESRGEAKGTQQPTSTQLKQPWEIRLLSNFYQQIHTEQHNNDKRK